jgi:hypothetical protein
MNPSTANTSTTTGDASEEETVTSLRYVNFEGPLNGSLPLLDASSLAQGCGNDIRSFQMDWTSAARCYANSMIARNTGDYMQQLGYGSVLNSTSVLNNNGTDDDDGAAGIAPPGSSGGAPMGSMPGSGGGMGAPLLASGMDGSGGGDGGVNVNSFGTNNQEKNVEEADDVQSDGTTGTTLSSCVLIGVHVRNVYGQRYNVQSIDINSNSSL